MEAGTVAALAGGITALLVFGAGVGLAPALIAGLVAGVVGFAAA